MLTRSYTLLEEALDRLVHSPEFDEQCIQCSKRNLSSSSDTDYSFQRRRLWETRDDSSVSSVESTGYTVSKLEAHLYYHGVRGNGKWGPKLIARSSQDVYVPPSGPAQDVRVLKLLPVSEHPRLSNENNLWPTIRSQVCDLLKRIAICRLTFVPRLLYLSTSEESSLRPWTSLVLAGRKRTRTTLPRSLSLTPRFGWESTPTVPPPTSHTNAATTSSICSTSSVSLTSTSLFVSRLPGLSVAQHSMHPSTIYITSRMSSIPSPRLWACLSLARRPLTCRGLWASSSEWVTIFTVLRLGMCCSPRMEEMVNTTTSVCSFPSRRRARF